MNYRNGLFRIKIILGIVNIQHYEKKFGLLRFLIENTAKIIINNWIVLIRSQIGLIFLIIEIYNTGKIRAWQRHAMTEKKPLLSTITNVVVKTCRAWKW